MKEKKDGKRGNAQFDFCYNKIHRANSADFEHSFLVWPDFIAILTMVPVPGPMIQQQRTLGILYNFIYVQK